MDAIKMTQLLARKLSGYTAVQLEAMGAYYALVCQWNARMNLTTVTEPAEAADKHFVDSLLACPFIPEGASCIDVGTGAGFPGVPIMIARPDVCMTLLDSLQKRVRFLGEATDTIGLSPRLVHARAEDAGHNPLYREQFDSVLSRAVAPLNVLLELTAPFARVGGEVIAYKGKGALEEARLAARAAELLGIRLEVTALDTSYGARYLVRGKKLAKTPACFARKAGEPSRKPLS